MAAKVLDAYAVMAFFENESGADEVHSLILKAEKDELQLYLSVINLGEVWYSIAREYSAKRADAVMREIEAMSIEVVDADWPLTRQAAGFKAAGRLSYGDCFAAALASTRNADLVTGDKEFKSLEGQIKIHWVGSSSQ